FEKITLASRTDSKCEAIAADILKNQGVQIDVASVNADSVDELVKLIEKVNPKLVINVALPYQDLTIMDDCTKCKVDYVDTANYEP
ncbi:saccharopine dehydrogenase NADP-binding domain-containing protein, partial [Aliarcobacter butzleri]